MMPFANNNECFHVELFGYILNTRIVSYHEVVSFLFSPVYQFYTIVKTNGCSILNTMDNPNESMKRPFAALTASIDPPNPEDVAEMPTDPNEPKRRPFAGPMPNAAPPNPAVEMKSRYTEFPRVSDHQFLEFLKAFEQYCWRLEIFETETTKITYLVDYKMHRANTHHTYGVLCIHGFAKPVTQIANQLKPFYKLYSIYSTYRLALRHGNEEVLELDLSKPTGLQLCQVYSPFHNDVDSIGIAIPTIDYQDHQLPNAFCQSFIFAAITKVDHKPNIMLIKEIEAMEGTVPFKIRTLRLSSINGWSQTVWPVDFTVRIKWEPPPSRTRCIVTYQG